jgi:hypothetical protein
MRGRASCHPLETTGESHFEAVESLGGRFGSEIFCILLWHSQLGEISTLQNIDSAPSSSLTAQKPDRRQGSSKRSKVPGYE